MKHLSLIIAVFVISTNILLSQNMQSLRLNNSYDSKENLFFKTGKETHNNWSLNLFFSDNGFGFGGQLFHQFSSNVSGFAGIFFSGAKDDREFEVYDIYGNSYVPNKVNRMFMIPVNLGVQFRLFRDDVTDDMRPHINFGLSPTVIIYTPYSEPFFPSFSHARSKYTLGAFASIGVDYVTSNTSSLNMDARYYVIQLFGQGIESLQSKEKKFFGGLCLVFSYNFMH